MWYVYLLRCADDTLYAGCTNDPQRRLQQHNAGQGAKYTRSRRPVTLVYLEQAEDHSQALRREAALKRLSRKEKLALIASALFPPFPRKRRPSGVHFFRLFFPPPVKPWIFGMLFFAECASSLAFFPLSLL